MINYYNYKRSIPTIEPLTKHFSEIDTVLLKNLFRLQTPTRDALKQQVFMRYILEWLKSNKIKVSSSFDEMGNLYITKGKASLYPCVVSHVDTVHAYNKYLSIVNTNNLIFGIDESTGQQHGIGADPKNGVYFAMQMLLHLKTCKVVFFVDEECGCIGSSNAEMEFFKDCSFVCQLDRRSFTTDIIENTNAVQVLSDEFKDAVFPIVEPYGYKFNTGTSTDVGQLAWNDLGICAFNFSNGSFNEHMNYETCSIPHLLNAVNAAYDIIINLGYQKRWAHIPEYEPVGKTSYSSYYKKEDDLYNYSTSTFSKKTVIGFIRQHIFRCDIEMSTKEAASEYLYPDETTYVENLLWYYDYYVGKTCNEKAVCNALTGVLGSEFGYITEVRKLVRAIDKFKKKL